MKQVLLRIEDDAFERFMGVVSLCQQVEVLSCVDEGGAGQDCDRCMVVAIRELQKNKVMQRRGDYAYIMQAANEGVVIGQGPFETPQKFLNYLKELGIQGLPSSSTLYDALTNIFDKYPHWTFRDKPDRGEALRRNNVVKQFLSAYGRAMRVLSEGSSE